MFLKVHNFLPVSHLANSNQLRAFFLDVRSPSLPHKKSDTTVQSLRTLYLPRMWAGGNGTRATPTRNRV